MEIAADVPLVAFVNVRVPRSWESTSNMASRAAPDSAACTLGVNARKLPISNRPAPLARRFASTDSSQAGLSTGAAPELTVTNEVPVTSKRSWA